MLSAEQQLLLASLDELEPATLLAVGAEALPAVEAYGGRHPECETVCVPDYPREALPRTSQRFRLGVIAGLIGRLPDAATRALIAALRDQYCDGLLLLAPEGRWPLADYLSLGFERHAAVDGNGGAFELYWYDADRCNPEREWNNPTHWAHPENFKRFRW
jgi:hypothetical protein